MASFSWLDVVDTGISIGCRIPAKTRQGETLKAYLTGLLLFSRAVTTDITQRTAQQACV
jgi:hypothetical protein